MWYPSSFMVGSEKMLGKYFFMENLGAHPGSFKEAI
jgi:hypothetical protein